MKNVVLFFSLICVCTSLFADSSVFEKLCPQAFTPEVRKALQEGEYRKVQELLNAQIEQAKDEEMSVLYLLLSLAYLKDQKEEEAFKAFITSLNKIGQAPITTTLPVCETYTKGLDLYLTQTEKPIKEVAEDLVKLLEPFLKSSPDAVEARFLLAAAQANLRNYEAFFQEFYTAYKVFPDAFLAYRALGVLHIKLYERTRLPEEKENYRKIIQNYLGRAMEKNNCDPMLYKLRLAFTMGEERKTVVDEVVNCLLTSNLILPRNEIPFFFYECLETGQQDLAKRFLDKATSWYQYSRVIENLKKEVEHAQDSSG